MSTLDSIYRPGIVLLLIIWAVACSRFDLEDYNFEGLEAKSEKQLRSLADTSRTLPRIAGLPDDKQRLDSLIYFTEWLKNYQEDIALIYAQQAYDLATKRNWDIPRAVSANRIATLKGRKVKFGEDVEDAMVDAKISKRLLEPYDNAYWKIDINTLLGVLFKRDAQLDSARFYYEAALETIGNLEDSEDFKTLTEAMTLHGLGTTLSEKDSLKKVTLYLQSDSLYQKLEHQKDLRARLWLDWATFHQKQNDFQPADSLLNLCIEYGHLNEDINILAEAYQEKGFVYSRQFNLFERNTDFEQALKNLKLSLEFEQANKYRTYEILGNLFQDSWAIDIAESHADSAIHYYKLATEEARRQGAIRTMKEVSDDLAYLYSYDGGRHQQALGESFEIFLDNNYAGVVDTLTKRSKIAYQRINRVEQRDIQVSAANKRRNQLLISLGVLFLAAMVFVFSLQRQQNRRLKAEMAALRAQINPHFISNSLNAIESLVNLGNSKAAAKYLVHFSRLSRQILTGSRTAFTSISNELSMVKHFLALEQLRFRDKLTFDIHVDPEVETDQVIIPTMTLQPYIENAILHGIKPKSDGGHVHIDIRKKEKILVISIEDNGIGRKKAQALKKASVLQHKSVGMKITQERLKALGRIKGAQIEIQDMEDEEGQATGTRVILRLPYKLESQPVNSNK